MSLESCQSQEIKQVADSTTRQLPMLSVPDHTFTASLNNQGRFFVISSPRLMFLSSFLERIMNGAIKITSDQFPNFLYDEDKAEELTEENPDDWDAEKGLLHSSLCLWVSDSLFICYNVIDSMYELYKCIFMGSGFWEPTDKKKKAPVSKINRLT
jgi:hypothetical protein